MEKGSFVYIVSNWNNHVLYIGVTYNLVRRVYEHKNGIQKGFTKKYGVTRLVYYEIFQMMTDAIEREKQIKAGSRQKKIDLIEGVNPGWKDLYYEITR